MRDSGSGVTQVDALVIGAGVVGLAVARALALAGREVVVVERHRLPGQETTSRNSGVIHSGIYYAPGSLKARLCVRGRSLLYAYCEERGIAHARCGKLIVAQSGQEAALQALEQKGRTNGVDDLRWLSAAEVAALEPELRCAAGLYSPSTGIVDVHEFVAALVADIESRQGSLVQGAEVRHAKVDAGGFVLTIDDSSGSFTARCGTLINSAGLQAVDFQGRIEGYPPGLRRTAYFAKGNYFVCRGARPFRHLVYPMPDEAGLGVHATLDLDGTIRFGPDVEWVTQPGYDVDPRRSDAFYDAIRQYWPGLKDGSLAPGYAGVRPKLVGAGAAAADFVIEGADVHGLPGLINLLGIESPGLTASLAIAEDVVRKVP